MLEKGMLLISLDSDEPKKYVLQDRLEDIGGGDGGWLCVSYDALEQGTDSISPFDCWRVTDRYIDTQIRRGVIQIVENV